MPSIQPPLPPYQDDAGHWHCGARSKRTGKPCTRPIVEEPHRCQTHGGSAPQVKAAKAARALEDKARRLIPPGIHIHGEPITRLLELAAECDAFRGAVADLVNNLNDRIRYRADGGEQLRAEVAVYERALDRATRVYLDVCKLNLEERLVRIREREAQAMLSALEKALAEAGLSVEQQQAVKGGTARHLRAVS